MKLESHLPRQSPWLYITPLLNAVLLLLVYYLLSRGFVIESGINVEKPRSSSRLTGFDHAHIITIAPGNEVPMYFDGRRVTFEELTQRLVDGRSGERRVIIHHDRQAPSGRVVEVINLAQELGFEAALSTTPSPAPLVP
ncbi:ExbD/TolR family protein [Prosthecobacter dejongeii]|uniref:Biopolymer transport protein ExbD n=1 Tax=Prosthecobacter dejongeii TaxID=48465 RepID=A0A7W8DPT0_9BACT|nr:biopolymer transporter ExbD [Prosthecobacter dejongeii]MBB5037251.1 biopolymer transport protein ExbD [Prosthecobacter dejongeii]